MATLARKLPNLRCLRGEAPANTSNSGLFHHVVSRYFNEPVQINCESDRIVDVSDYLAPPLIYNSTLSTLTRIDTIVITLQQKYISYNIALYYRIKSCYIILLPDRNEGYVIRETMRIIKGQ